MKQAFAATIDVLIDHLDSEPEVCDFVSETLNGAGVYDWQYSKHPSPTTIPDGYAEGDHWSDDRLPANAEWVSTFTRHRRGYTDQFILDEISSDYYLRFDCSPLVGQETEDCSVLLHPLPEGKMNDNAGVELLAHATRGDVRRLLDVLQVIPKKLARP